MNKKLKSIIIVCVVFFINVSCSATNSSKKKSPSRNILFQNVLESQKLSVIKSGKSHDRLNVIKNNLCIRNPTIICPDIHLVKSSIDVRKQQARKRLCRENPLNIKHCTNFLFVDINKKTLAYSTPSAIYINDTALLKFKIDSELAFIIAHEMAHVQFGNTENKYNLKYKLKQYFREKNGNKVVANVATKLLSEYLSREYNLSLIEEFIVGLVIEDAVPFIEDYLYEGNRDIELSADLNAVTYISNAKYNQGAALKVLRALKFFERKNSYVCNIIDDSFTGALALSDFSDIIDKSICKRIKTHPTIKERVNNIKSTSLHVKPKTS